MLILISNSFYERRTVQNVTFFIKEKTHAIRSFLRNLTVHVAALKLGHLLDVDEMVGLTLCDLCGTTGATCHKRGLRIIERAIKS